MELFNTNNVINFLNEFLDQQTDVTVKKEINAAIALLAKNSKKGLSARDLAKDIISKQSEAGAPVGPLKDGTESISEKMEYVRVKAILEHIIENARIQVVIPPGTQVIGQVATATGIYPIKGNTVSIAKGVAIIT